MHAGTVHRRCSQQSCSQNAHKECARGTCTRSGPMGRTHKKCTGSDHGCRAQEMYAEAVLQQCPQRNSAGNARKECVQATCAESGPLGVPMECMQRMCARSGPVLRAGSAGRERLQATCTVDVCGGHLLQTSARGLCTERVQRVDQSVAMVPRIRRFSVH